MVLGRLVAALLKEAPSVLLADRSERLRGGFEECLEGPRLRLSQQVFHFGEGSFYGVEVRSVARKVPQLASLLLDELSDPFALVYAEVVHEDDLCPLLRVGARMFLM